MLLYGHALPPHSRRTASFFIHGTRPIGPKDMKMSQRLGAPTGKQDLAPHSQAEVSTFELACSARADRALPRPSPLHHGRRRRARVHDQPLDREPRGQRRPCVVERREGRAVGCLPRRLVDALEREALPIPSTFI